VIHPLSLERLAEPVVPPTPAKSVEVYVDILDLLLDFAKPPQAAVAAAGAGLVPRYQSGEPLRQFLRRHIQLQSLDHFRRPFSTCFDTARGTVFKDMYGRNRRAQHDRERGQRLVR
jgi:hypothetical protein